MQQLQQTKNIRILACMVSASVKNFIEIISKKGGRWKPVSICVVKNINDVMVLKVKIEEGLLG